MSISKDDYSKMTDKASPNSPKVLNCIKAFLIGGTICLIGQILFMIFEKGRIGRKGSFSRNVKRINYYNRCFNRYRRF